MFVMVGSNTVKQSFKTAAGGGSSSQDLDNRDLTQQDGWKTKDGRMMKKCSARLCIPGVGRHFFVILPF